MMQARTLFYAAVVVVAVALVSVFLFGAGHRQARTLEAVSPVQPSQLPGQAVSTPVQQPSGPVLQPPVQVDAQALLPVGTFPPGKPIIISVEGVKDTKNAKVSWTDAEWQPFYLVLFDWDLFKTNAAGVEKQPAVLYGISSIKQGQGGLPLNGTITSQDIAGQLPSGYVIGDSSAGFKQPPSAAGRLELTIGKQYMLQVDGLDKQGKIIIVNKQFNYTASCLPPDCQ